MDSLTGVSERYAVCSEEAFSQQWRRYGSVIRRTAVDGFLGRSCELPSLRIQLRPLMGQDRVEEAPVIMLDLITGSGHG
jgi:hypothetical protein